jgi:hypothetical protein
VHPNGLVNRHLKFRDGTEVELMTVVGAPGDAMAREYEGLLRDGEGGAYVALRLGDLEVVQRQAAGAGLVLQGRASGSLRFLGFPPSSPASAVFFVEGRAVALDPDSVLLHDPAVSGLAEVWLEGGAALGDLLHRLGATVCGAARAPDGREGERWVLARGGLVVVPPRSGSPARVLGAVLETPAHPPGMLWSLPGLWIRYR